VKRRAPSVLVAFALTLGTASSAAQVDPPAELRFRTAVDLPLTLGIAGAYVLSEAVLKGKLSPKTARWNDRDHAGNDALNAFDRAGTRLRWAAPREAATMSDFLLASSFLNAQSFAYVASTVDGDSRAHAGENLLMIVEATSIAALTNQITKLLAGRERPCAHFAARSSVLPCGSDAHDQNLSFFSGHATVTSALAVSSGTIASLRGYSLAPLVWASGSLLALGTGYLRIAADKHYLSDVLTGLAVGSAIGALVPLLGHGRTSAVPPSDASLGAPLGAASFGYSGRF
jgi:membrane-associated phospholipid phosphatase